MLIRDYAPADAGAVVALSLRAWAPVFASMEQVLGHEIVLRLRSAGRRVAMIGTGGDPGHAPARRVYEKADYALIPMARYFKAL